MEKQITTQDTDINKQIRYVSHEIRNHLSICDMYSQIIKKNIEKAGLKNDSIENALSCIQQSIQIIGSNVLDLKSINNNSKKILDFKTILEKGIQMSKAYVEDKNIEFYVFIKNTAFICVDENRLISCIVNIIKNGIESIDIKGKITVLGEIKDNTAIIKISNDGRQIPRDKQNDIFTIGYTTKNTGCGLGLGICKKYLESQNSQLELVKSTKTETRFDIKIPVYVKEIE